MLTLTLEFILDEKEKSGKCWIVIFKLFYSDLIDVLVEKYRLLEKPKSLS